MLSTNNAVQWCVDPRSVELLHELENYDTPTVTNAVATYPGDTKNCLGLYEPNGINWYTDERIRCLYPSVGPRCGFAVTCVYGVPGPGFSRLQFTDILKEIHKVQGPVILAMKLHAPEKWRRKNALIGGNMMTAFKQLGVVGVVGDGPARDLEEMRPLGVQCLFTGLTAGHGTLPIEAVNVPVSLCSMDVAPYEIIHMDANGAVKFPAERLEEVLERVKRIAAHDAQRQERMRKSCNPTEIAEIMKGIYR